MSIESLPSIRKQFEAYKVIGEKAMSQVPDDGLFWQYNAESNSIANIVKHLAGNMLSRWTDFRTTDGEKEWRHRDAEFENDLQTRDTVMALWNAGWKCLFEAIGSMSEDELDNILYIRAEAHTFMEAVYRQLAHYPYHVGQIVFIAKMIADAHWNSMSIPRNGSDDFNATKFAKG